MPDRIKVIIEILLGVIIIFSIVKIFYYIGYIYRMDYETNIKPLKMKELKHMVAKPVWVKRYNEWMIIHSATDTLVEMIDHNGALIVFDEDDLKRTPLFRKKEERCLNGKIIQ